MTRAAVAEMKAMGEVCLDDGENRNQNWELAIDDSSGGKRSALPTRIGFKIAVGALNGYTDGRIRRSSGEYRLRLATMA